MESKDLLKFCKYYKGESKNPFEGKDQNAMMFWGYERDWCETNSKALANESCDAAKKMESIIASYSKAGLSSFRIEDDTPLSLKALLFNRFDHWFEGTPEDFKGWYTRRYLKA